MFSKSAGLAGYGRTGIEEWWRSDRWWELYPDVACPGAPPLELALDALAAAPVVDVYQLLVFLAGVYSDRAPSIDTLIYGPSPEEVPHMGRFVTACMGGWDCKSAAGTYGETGDVESLIRDRFFQIIDRYLVGTPTEVETHGGTVPVATIPPEERTRPTAERDPETVELGLTYPTGPAVSPAGIGLAMAAAALVFFLPARGGR